MGQRINIGPMSSHETKEPDRDTDDGENQQAKNYRAPEHPGTQPPIDGYRDCQQSQVQQSTRVDEQPGQKRQLSIPAAKLFAKWTCSINIPAQRNDY